MRNGATQQGRGVIHCAHVTSEGTLRAIVCRLKGILRSENVTQLFHVNAVAGGASVQFLKLGFRRGDTRVVRAAYPGFSLSNRFPRAGQEPRADQFLNRARSANHLFTITSNMHNVREKFGPLARQDLQFCGDGGHGVPLQTQSCAAGCTANRAEGRTHGRLT